MPHVVISAAHKSSGKTTVSIGLCAALSDRGLVVQPFKKGPDYIDPMWLASASGRDCYNLDFFTMQHDEIMQNFANYNYDADISIIEGNKGLYDGLDLDGSNSNAALATLLDAPVVLVLDARGMTRGIAPLVLGYQAFDKNINIAGVILNQLGGSRHEGKLRRVIEHYTDVKVIGAIHRHSDMAIVERHLGLVPSNESDSAAQYIANISKHIKDSVDLDQFIDIAATAPPSSENIVPVNPVKTSCRIAVARDAAFGFYYASDINAMRDTGVDIVNFDTINDDALPQNIDGLFIGGGFPESSMQLLEDNTSMRQSIYDAIEAGLPTYAECGGMMYLSQSLSWNDKINSMVGIIPGDTIMHKKPQGRGYVKIKESEQFIWPQLESDSSKQHQAHEFHYSSLENFKLNNEFQPAYEMKRGHGINGEFDGIMYKNMLACYAHQRNVDSNPWVKRFIQFILINKSSQNLAGIELC